jgi:hypothetical protein
LAPQINWGVEKTAPGSPGLKIAWSGALEQGFKKNFPETGNGKIIPCLTSEVIFFRGVGRKITNQIVDWLRFIGHSTS